VSLGPKLSQEGSDVQGDDHPEGDRDEDDGDRRDFDQEPDLFNELAPRPGPPKHDVKGLEPDREHLPDLFEQARGLSNYS
jgi:hypothetical protein